MQSKTSEGGEDEQLAECDDPITAGSGDGCVEVSGDGCDEAREPKVAPISEGNDMMPSSASLLSDLLTSLYEEEKQHKSKKLKSE